MVLEGDASDITFASYFGGNTSQEHVDGGTSRFDRTGKIYQAVCAGCGSNDDFPIAPSDAWSPTNNSSNCNLGVAKIDFDLPLIFANFEFSTACIPDPVMFDNTSNLYTGSTPNYEWTFPNNEVLTTENPSYVFDAPGTYQIQLVVSDPLACNLSDTIVKTVVVYSELELNIPDQFTSCDTDQFEIIALNNQSANFFEWSENADFTDIIQAGETDSILNYTADVQQEIYLRLSNGFCELIDTILVSPAPILDLSTGDTLICAEGEFDVSFTIEGGTGITNIVWGPTEKLLTGQGTAVAAFEASEPFNITLNVGTEFGCEFEENIQIDVYPIFLEASDDTLSCGGEPITLSASSGGSADSFIWSDQSDLSNILNPNGDSTITVTPTSLAYYYVLVENNGCFLKDSVAVSLLSAGTSITSDQYICLGDTASIFVNNDFPNSELQHYWEPDEYIISGQNTNFIQVVVDQPTTFEVTSQTVEGCVVVNSTTIFLSPLGGMEVDAIADPIYLTEGQSSQLTSNLLDDSYIYQWTPSTFLSNPNGTSTMSTPTETITYFLTITDFTDNGACMRTDSVTVFLYESECGEPNIFVPNAFTPNGDGENDQLWVRGGGITKMEFSIYDRWGENVFETTNQSVGWDGTYKGVLGEPAVYVYYLRVDCDGGESYFKKGNVTLIR
jgi:gliding motility-associated-like protein